MHKKRFNTFKLLTLSIFCLSPFLGFSQITKKEKQKSDSYKIESKFIGNDSLLVSDLYMQAIVAENFEMDTVKAFTIFNEILKIDSLHAPSLFYKALYANSLNQGLAYINKAIQVDSTNTDYYAVKMLYCKRAGMFDQAIKACETMIKLDDKNIEFHLKKASIQDVSGVQFQAITTLENAISIFGQQIELLYYLQDIYRRVNRSDKVIEIVNKLLTILPDNIDFIMLLTEAYVNNSEISKAREYFELARQIDPLSLAYQSGICEFYNRYGTKKQFLNALNQLFANKELALESKIDYFNNNIKNIETYQQYYYEVESLVNTLRITHSGTWSVDKLYATHLINIGLAQAAGEVYKKHLNANSANRLDAYRQVIAIEDFLNEEPDSALKYCLEAIEIFTEDIPIKLQTANIFAENGQIEKSKKLVDWCIKNAENDSLKSEYIGFLGDISHKIGDNKSAYKYYDKALKVNPNNIVALNNYSYYLSLENTMLDKALEMSMRTIEIEPNNSTYLDTYGWILHKLGRNEEAKDIIKRAVAIDTNNSSELLIHLGDIYLALGDEILAEVYWDRAIKAGADIEEINKRKLEIQK
ncbi:MAG: hypothetical protein R3Y04_06395 [Rikenellaceae bacterium]